MEVCLLPAATVEKERLAATPLRPPLAKVRVAVIENPASGFNRRHPGALGRYCEEFGLPYRAGHSPKTLESAVRELLALEPEVLAVSGGDGTVSFVLGALRRAECPPPALALLRGGSTNMIHRELGLRGSPARALDVLRRILETGTPEMTVQWRSPLAVSSRGEPGERVGFFFAVGAMQRVLRACQELSARAGWRGWTVEFLGLMLSFCGLLARRRASGHILRPNRISWVRRSDVSAPGGGEGERLFVYLTSLNRLLFGFDPCGRRDALKLVGIRHPFRKRTLVSYLALRGRSEAPDVEHDSADEYSLRFSEQWVLDGEFYGNPGGTNTVTVRTCQPVPFLVF